MVDSSREAFEREDDLIERLDMIAQEFNSADFGLPWADAPLDAMREAVRAYGQASRSAAIEECAARAGNREYHGMAPEEMAERLRALKGEG